jgi:hypothetical protein
MLVNKSLRVPIPEGVRPPKFPARHLSDDVAGT